MTAISIVDAERRSRVQDIVRRYLASTRTGHEGDYQIEILPQHASGSIVVVQTVHHDDESAQGRGPSRSVQLQVDLQSGQVVRELAYQ